MRALLAISALVTLAGCASINGNTNGLSIVAGVAEYVWSAQHDAP